MKTASTDPLNTNCGCGHPIWCHTDHGCIARRPGPTQMRSVRCECRNPKTLTRLAHTPGHTPLTKDGE
jgi:hypothetical protein